MTTEKIIVLVLIVAGCALTALGKYADYSAKSQDEAVGANNTVLSRARMFRAYYPGSISVLDIFMRLRCRLGFHKWIRTLWPYRWCKYCEKDGIKW